MLSHPFFLIGEVKKDRQIGRTIHFPTANIFYPKEKYPLKIGVYETRVEVNGKSECYIFERNEMLSLRFHETVSTYIEEIKEQIAANPLRFIDGELLFGKEMDGKTYWVFDAAGKEIMSDVVKCDSPVSLEKLPTGFYLAEVDKYKLKVMVR